MQETGDVTRVVVVGYGMAGVRLVDELRGRSSAARLHVTAFGAEAAGAYNRVLLSGVLAGTMNRDRIRMGPRDLAGDGYEVHVDTTVESIDRAAKKVLTSAGACAYDVLVLATGSRPIVPDIVGIRDDDGRIRRNVLAFRTLDDCDAILCAADDARRAVVLGGGLLGLEAARGVAARGLDVEVLHRTGHLMDRQLDREAGDVLAATVSDLGVRVRTGAVTTRVLADEQHGGRVRAVELADGTLLETDLLVVTAGVVPETALAREAGLAVDRGIVIDDELQSITDENVFAIGECAQHDGRVYGLVAPAWEQARVLADVLTGHDGQARYAGSRLVTRLKVDGVELAAMGETEARHGTDVVTFSDPARRTYKKLVLRDGRIAGAILLGDTSTAGTVTQLFDRQGIAPADPVPLLFAGMRRSVAENVEAPAHIPDRATVCHCNSVTKGQITRCWLSGARSIPDVADATRATTGCGGCTGTVAGLLDWLRASDPEPTTRPA